MVVLGACALDQGDSPEAARWAERALEVNSRNADAYLLKGAILQSRGQKAEARQAYQRYLELAPNGDYVSDVRVILQSL